MTPTANLFRTIPAQWLRTLAIAWLAAMAGGALAADTKVDEAEMASYGFKPLVAETKTQKEWVHTMKPGTMRPMQRNGHKVYVVADPAKDRVFVGGPTQYAAYMEKHPGSQTNTQAAANKATAERSKSGQAMQEATGRDASDPYLGATWIPTWRNLGYY